jgi:hypothetical protein
VAAIARRREYTAVMAGLLQIEDCLDANGGIVLPPGVTLISLIDRNIENVGDAVAYRYPTSPGRRRDSRAKSPGPNSGSGWKLSARASSRSPTGAIEWRSWRRRASTTSQAFTRR